MPVSVSDILYITFFKIFLIYFMQYLLYNIIIAVQIDNITEVCLDLDSFFMLQIEKSFIGHLRKFLNILRLSCLICIPKI